MKNETDSLKKNLFKSSEILIVDNQKKYDNREMSRNVEMSSEENLTKSYKRVEELEKLNENLGNELINKTSEIEKLLVKFKSVQSENIEFENKLKEAHLNLDESKRDELKRLQKKIDD